MQEANVFTLSSTVRSFLALLIQVSHAAELVTHHEQSCPSLQVHCSDPAGSSIALKIKQFTVHKWRVQRMKQTPGSQGMQRSEGNIVRYSPASVTVVQNMQIAFHYFMSILFVPTGQ